MDYEYHKEERQILMSYIRTSEWTDPALLAPNLRAADLEEIAASTHLSPYEVLQAGFSLSEPCRTFVGDSGDPVGMFGVAPLPNKVGVIWCLTTPELFKMKKYFMRNCRREIEEITNGYDKVINFVYSKNTTHIRWIKAMGFKMEASPRPFGWQEKPFYYFEKVIT